MITSPFQDENFALPELRYLTCEKKDKKTNLLTRYKPK